MRTTSAPGRRAHSVLTGLTSSARVITAAALIMISVFASFVLGDDPTIKMFGLGFSIAVLLDATVVRMMIVPAVMALFGDRAWALPRWLDRALPDLDVEGQHLIEELDDAEDGRAGRRVRVGRSGARRGLTDGRERTGRRRFRIPGPATPSSAPGVRR